MKPCCLTRNHVASHETTLPRVRPHGYSNLLNADCAELASRLHAGSHALVPVARRYWYLCTGASHALVPVAGAHRVHLHLTSVDVYCTEAVYLTVSSRASAQWVHSRH